MPTPMQKGSHGADVQKLQQALMTQGYVVGTADGQYGDKTAAAVAYFQSVYSLNITGNADAHVLDYLGIVDDHDSVHMELPAADVINGPGHYTVQVTGTSAKEGVRIVVWFRGGGGEHHSEATINLVANQAVPATVDVPVAVVEHTGEWHVLVNAFVGSESIGEKVGTVHVHHEGAAAH